MSPMDVKFKLKIKAKALIFLRKVRRNSTVDHFLGCCTKYIFENFMKKICTQNIYSVFDTLI